MTLAFQTSIPLRTIIPILPSVCKARIATRSRVPTAAMKVDAHVHVWDQNYPPHPDHPLPDNLLGTAADLVQKMDLAGINKTVIVQPINYKFNHSCVADAVTHHPNRFAAVALANTSLSPAKACQELEHLVAELGFRGVRLNPTFTDTGFADETVKAVVRKAGELDVPVTLFARQHHLDDVATLLQGYPDTKILLDHFAFCKPGKDEAAMNKVLAMGRRFDQLYVKTSAWFRVSGQPWPHRDLHAPLTDLLSAFGANRLLIGSDYPFVKEQYDYSQAFKILDEAPISPDDKEWVSGKTAAALYKL